MTCAFLIQLVFCKKKKKWIIGVEVGQETSAPPPKKNPGSAPAIPWGTYLTELASWRLVALKSNEIILLSFLKIFTLSLLGTQFRNRLIWQQLESPDLKWNSFQDGTGVARQF